MCVYQWRSGRREPHNNEQTRTFLKYRSIDILNVSVREKKTGQNSFMKFHMKASSYIICVYCFSLEWIKFVCTICIKYCTMWAIHSVVSYPWLYYTFSPSHTPLNFPARKELHCVECFHLIKKIIHWKKNNNEIGFGITQSMLGILKNIQEFPFISPYFMKPSQVNDSKTLNTKTQVKIYASPNDGALVFSVDVYSRSLV